MSTSKSNSVAKKKKRLVQLRDAQRRRRERLREDRQHFVQIILPEETLGQLSRLIAISGETMQQAIARLVQSALPTETEALSSAEEIVVETIEIEIEDEPVAQMEEPPPMMIEREPEPFFEEIPASFTEEETATAKVGQLDLFG